MPSITQPFRRLGSQISGMFRRPGETPADRAAWLDQTVRQVVGVAYQQELRSHARSFETAETPSYTESWATTAGELNETLRSQLPTIRSRTRNTARNNEWAEAYLIQLNDNVLGDQGIKLQMRVKNSAGKPDTEANAIIENWFAKWGERGNCEVSGKMTWQELESLALASLPLDGELVWRPRPGKGPLGWQMQLLPATIIDVYCNRTWGGNKVQMGVEYDDDGKVLAYWLKARKATQGTTDGLTSVGPHVRIAAEQMHHHFLAKEVDQLRGIPWLSIGSRRLWLLHDFEQAAAVASSNAAKRQGFFTSPDGNAPPGFADQIVSSVLDAAKAAGKVLTPDEIKAITASAEKYTTVVPGQFDTLPVGYGFQAFESAWPNINADSHVKQHIRGWSAARGASYNSIGNDLESVNYSSAQVGIVQEREHFKFVQARFMSWLHNPVVRDLMPYIVLSEPRLKMSRLQSYLDGIAWQPRRWSPVDPVKAAVAKQIMLSLKLASRRRLIAENGEDPDEVLQEATEEEKLYGPVVPRAGTPNQGNDNQSDNKKTDNADD